MAYGIGYLKRQLNSKTSRIRLRYKYYEMKNAVKDLGISTPPDLRYWFGTLGWCAKAVDSLADRLQFYRFEDDNFDMNGIFNMNNPDTLFDSAILSALIASCSFIYISADQDGFPVLQVIDGANGTGIIDDTTGLLKEGYAVLERDQMGNVVREAYLDSEYSYVYTRGVKDPEVYINPAPYPLLVPVIYRPDYKRPFGHSRISRACMGYTNSAIRTIKRSEIAAEFFSFPQKYVTGLSQDAEPMEKWKATMSSMLTFTKDEDGDKPTPGTFTQQSMEPHLTQLKTFAALFAGETGLTMDDLGFATDNPSSAEAIKASHENLRLTARKAQRTFGSGFLNAGYLAACVRDNVEYERRQVYLTHASWDPIFEADASQLSGIGDAILKLNQAIPGYIDEDRMRNITGIK